MQLQLQLYSIYIVQKIYIPRKILISATKPDDFENFENTIKKKEKEKKTSIQRFLHALFSSNGNKTNAIKPTLIRLFNRWPTVLLKRSPKTSPPRKRAAISDFHGAIPKHGKSCFGESSTAANNYVITAIRGGGEAVCNRARLRYTDVGQLFPLTIDQCIITRE